MDQQGDESPHRSQNSMISACEMIDEQNLSASLMPLGSGCLTIVVTQQPTQPRATADSTDIVVTVTRQDITSPSWNVSQALVRPEFVVVVRVSLSDVVKLPQAEAEEVVQTLPLEVADPGFRVAIRDGSGDGREHRTTVVSAEVLVKGLGELRIVVVDEETDVDAYFLSPHIDIASLLLHPYLVRTIGGRGEKALRLAR